MSSQYSEFFFDTIYSILPQYDKETPESLKSKSQFLLKFTGPLFLIGLYHLLKGSVNSRQFLQSFSLIYISTYVKPNEFEEIKQNLLETEDITSTIIHYFGERVAEQIVAAWLQIMSDPKFKGSFKSMVDIISPWIRLFRMLPNQAGCIPTFITTEKRLKRYSLT